MIEQGRGQKYMKKFFEQIPFGKDKTPGLVRHVAEQVYRLSKNPTIGDVVKVIANNCMTEEDAVGACMEEDTMLPRQINANL
jgi:hypothetical protein